jgi:hypothetical protein
MGFQEPSCTSGTFRSSFACSSHPITRRTLLVYGAQGHFAHLPGVRTAKPWMNAFYPEHYPRLCVEPIVEKRATFRQLLPPSILCFPGPWLHGDVHRTPAIGITGSQSARHHLRKDRSRACLPGGKVRESVLPLTIAQSEDLLACSAFICSSPAGLSCARARPSNPRSTRPPIHHRGTSTEDRARRVHMCRQHVLCIRRRSMHGASCSESGVIALRARYKPVGEVAGLAASYSVSRGRSLDGMDHAAHVSSSHPASTGVLLFLTHRRAAQQRCNTC